MKSNTRVLLSKIGLDGHDRGIVTVGLALKDAGFEVIYLGRQQFPEDIVQTALQEDPDVIGISSLADAHVVLMPKLIKQLREKNIKCPVILGGFVHPDDIPMLKEAGVAQIFGPGTPMAAIVSWIKDAAAVKK